MAACKKCGEAIKWQMVRGKWNPTDRAGRPHWITCKAQQNRTLEIRRGPTIVGKEYKASCGKCDVPPWEECECSFTSAERANQEADERLAAALDEED